MDILVNFSFLIEAIILFAVIHFINYDEFAHMIISMVGFLVYGLVYSFWLRAGHGNTIVAIVTHLIFFVPIIFALIALFLGYATAIFDIGDFLIALFLMFIIIALTIYALLCVYARLSSENVLHIDFIDKNIKEIAKKIDNISFADKITKHIPSVKKFFSKIHKFFSAIVNNEWFKGISIGVISAVIGGLVLNKITKADKYTNDGNENPYKSADKRVSRVVDKSDNQGSDFEKKLEEALKDIKLDEKKGL